MEGAFVSQGKVFQNPTEIDTIVNLVDAAIVTLTGGEPLLQVDFARHVCVQLRSMGKIMYLDTNATLPDALETIIDQVDIVSLDFKVPTATGRPQLWIEHKACLEISASQGKAVYIKMVINENLLPRELETACTLIQEIDRSIPLVIQPVYGSEHAGLLDVQKKALAYLDDVRIIPQVHKYLHVQ